MKLAPWGCPPYKIVNVRCSEDASRVRVRVRVRVMRLLDTKRLSTTVTITLVKFLVLPIDITASYC